MIFPVTENSRGVISQGMKYPTKGGTPAEIYFWPVIQ